MSATLTLLPPVTEHRAQQEQFRVVVVDPAAVVHAGLSATCTQVQWAGVEVDPLDVLIHRPQADVLLVEMNMLEARGNRLVRRFEVEALTQAGYQVILHTLEQRPLVLARAQAAGAVAIVSKADGPAALRVALEAVARGESGFTSPSVPALAGVCRLGVPMLTGRQWQVLMGRLAGRSWRELSQEMFITQGVAREHLAALEAKLAPHLGCTSTAQLAWSLGISPSDTYPALVAQRELVRRALAAR